MIRSSFIVSMLAALGSALTFLNQLVLARFFGAGLELDTYLVAISLPATIAGLGVGVLGFQVVPALRHYQDVAGFDRAVSGLTLGLGSIAAVIALIGAASLPWLLPHLLVRLTGADAATAMPIAVLAWSWFPLAVAGAVLTAALHMLGKFSTATALQPLPAVGALIGCWLGRENGIVCLAWGQLAGYMLMIFLLQLSAGNIGAKPDWKQAGIIARQTPLALASLLVFAIYPLADAIWGAHAGDAGVSLLGYGQRLTVGFSGLAVVGASTVLFPRLARQAAAGDEATAVNDLSRSLRTMLACMAPAAAVLAIAAEPLVRLLFMRGAFSPEDAAALAALLAWMLPGMVAMSCLSLAFRAFFARGRIRTAALLSVVGALVYCVLSELLVGKFGLRGIGAAYAATWWLLFIPTVRLLGVRLGGAVFWGRLVAVTTAASAAALATRACFPLAEMDTPMPALGGLLAIACAAMVAFAATTLIWPGLDEIKAVKKGLLR